MNRSRVLLVCKLAFAALLVAGPRPAVAAREPHRNLTFVERVAAQVFPAIQNARAHAVALRMTEAHAELDVFPPLASGARASLK